MLSVFIGESLSTKKPKWMGMVIITAGHSFPAFGGGNVWFEILRYAQNDMSESLLHLY